MSTHYTMEFGNGNSSNFTQGEILVPKEISTKLVTFLIALGLILMLMNGVVVCCGLLYRSKLNNAYSMQILSLSVSDFIIGFVVISMSVGFRLPGEKGLAPCAASFAMYLATQCASLLHIFGICLHRFFMVMFKTTPGLSRSSYKRVAIYIAFTWLISPAVTAIPFAIFAQTGQALTRCSLNGIFGDSYKRAMSVLMGILLIPLLLTDGFYLLFICFLKKLRRRVEPTDALDMQHRIIERTAPADGSQRDGKTNGEERIPKDGGNRTPSPGTSGTTGPLNGSGKKQLGVLQVVSSVASTSTREAVSTEVLPNSPQPGVAFNAGQGSRHCHYFTKSANTLPPDYIPKTPEPTTRRRPHQTVAVTTIGILLLVLNVCSLPLLVSLLVESMADDISLSRDSKTLPMLAMLVNGGVNPVVYIVRMRAFRMCLVDMFTKFARRIRLICE